MKKIFANILVMTVSISSFMPGIDAQALRLRRRSRRRVALQRLGLARRAMGAGIGLGVQLDALGAGRCGMHHGLGLRVHEQADAHAQRLRLLHQRRQPQQIVGQAPAMVGGELVFAVGHKGALRRPELAHEGHQVLRRVAFDVVVGAGEILQ